MIPSGFKKNLVENHKETGNVKKTENWTEKRGFTQLAKIESYRFSSVQFFLFFEQSETVMGMNLIGLYNSRRFDWLRRLPTVETGNGGGETVEMGSMADMQWFLPHTSDILLQNSRILWGGDTGRHLLILASLIWD